MLGIKLICVGKIKEGHYCDAVAEYEKRLKPYYKFEIEELAEQRTPDAPSAAELDIALAREATEIFAAIPKGAYVVAMCIEGELLSSEGLSDAIESAATRGASKLCFIIGGSFGLHETIKKAADRRLSMSKMTFPHHLARVVLVEQIYRAAMISSGTKYHK